MKKIKFEFSKNTALKSLKIFVVALAWAFVASTSSFAQGLPMGTSGGAASTASPGAAGVGFMNMQLPLFVGGSFGLGSGTGVGDGHDVGVCQIRPMIGAWMPGLAFVRLGYGFSNYKETDDEGKTNKVKSSDFSIDLGAHLLSEFYVMGSYSRASALSENGDVSWNEWSLGFGSFWAVFTRTMLTLDIGYHWVRKHYDPFLDKDVSGGRMQMNLGFVVFVY